jgi:hypothetical protein|nr:MAG TPA: hypothetical protein [Caudoviricetes sp.]
MTGRCRNVRELIGFNLMAFAVTTLLTWVTNLDFDLKEILGLIVGEVLFLGTLSTGIYLMVY